MLKDSEAHISEQERRVKLEIIKLLLTLGSILAILSHIIKDYSTLSLYYFLVGLFVLSGIGYISALLFGGQGAMLLSSIAFASSFSALLSLLLTLPSLSVDTIFSYSIHFVYFIILIGITLLIFMILTRKPKL